MNRKHADVTSESRRHRPVVMATVAASLLMLVFGLGYRVLAARLAAPVNAASVPQAALERLPLQIGDWTGQDVALDEATIRATDTDAHVNRRYSRHNSLESISLYIAGGIKARDLMPHRPEVCYTGAGWTLVDRRFVELPLAEGKKLPCNILRFSRGTLKTERVTVLDYYIVDGQYCHDVSLLRSKAWRGSGAVGYVAQVQIVTSVAANLTGDTAEQAVSAFAAESAPSVFGLFESAAEVRHADDCRSDANDTLGGTGRD